MHFLFCLSSAIACCLSFLHPSSPHQGFLKPPSDQFKPLKGSFKTFQNPSNPVKPASNPFQALQVPQTPSNPSSSLQSVLCSHLRPRVSQSALQFVVESKGSRSRASTEVLWGFNINCLAFNYFISPLLSRAGGKQPPDCAILRSKCRLYGFSDLLKLCAEAWLAFLLSCLFFFLFPFLETPFCKRFWCLQLSERKGLFHERPHLLLFSSKKHPINVQEESEHPGCSVHWLRGVARRLASVLSKTLYRWPTPSRFSTNRFIYSSKNFKRIHVGVKRANFGKNR